MYSETIIDNVLHYRNSLNEDWTPLSQEELTQRVLQAERLLQSYGDQMYLTLSYESKTESNAKWEKGRLVKITQLNREDSRYDRREEIYASIWITGDYKGFFHPHSKETYRMVDESFNEHKEYGLCCVTKGLTFEYLDALTFIPSDFAALDQTIHKKPLEDSLNEATKQFINSEDCPVERASRRAGLSGDIPLRYDVDQLNAIREQLLEGVESITVPRIEF